MKHLSVCAGLFLLLVSSCVDAGDPVDADDLGTFSYVAYDTSGAQIVRGTLILHTDGTKITGSWRFDDGRSGELEGFIDGDLISLNLNPGWVDANLLLHGTLTGRTYAGDWEQIGFPGVMARGTFSATRR